MTWWGDATTVALGLMVFSFLAAYLFRRKAQQASDEANRGLGFRPEEQIARLERTSDRCAIAGILLAVAAVALSAMSFLDIPIPS